MNSEKRNKLFENRQRILDLLENSKWNLILGEYKEASFKIDEIKKIMDEIIADLVAKALG